MGEARNDGPEKSAPSSGPGASGASGPSEGAREGARGTGSSLTDAVVAALANVSTPPPMASPEEERTDGVTSSMERLSDGGRGTVPDASSEEEETVTRTSLTVITGGDPTPSEAPDEERARDDATEPSTTRAPAPPSENTLISSSEGEPTVRLGGVAVEHLTPESAKETPDGIVVQYYGRTDVGLVREHNEDNFLVVDLSHERRGLGETPAILRTSLGDRGLVLAVCDGMGGAAAGEVASQMAVDTIHEIMQAGAPPRDRDQFARRLVRAVEEAGARIFSAAKMDRTRRGMGTTATVAGMIDSTLFVGQVGDSRAYVLRGDQFALITKDQSLVNQLIEAGQLTEEEAEAFEHSNIILQALGTTEEVTVDLTFLELRRGDRLLMCSDGLSGLVHADMMREVLRSSRDLSEAAQQLIAMANAGGGHDNITVICAEFDGAGLKPYSPEVRVAYQQYPLPAEDPANAEPLSPRATAIKTGGPKPGADVKVEGARERARSEGGASGRWWVAGLVLLFILVCVAAVIVLMDDGERTSAADEPTRVTIESTVSSRSAPRDEFVAEARVAIRTDATEGVLFVDGEARPGALQSGEPLALPAGAHRLEIRQGDARVSEALVTLEAGQNVTVDLTTPEGSMPELGADPEVSDGPSATAAAARPAGAAPERARRVPSQALAPQPLDSELQDESPDQRTTAGGAQAPAEPGAVL